jgi:hypothetical protein
LFFREIPPREMSCDAVEKLALPFSQQPRMLSAEVQLLPIRDDRCFDPEQLGPRQANRPDQLVGGGSRTCTFAIMTGPERAADAGQLSGDVRRSGDPEATAAP